ncbi:hypothetical protein SLS64_006025 [Diaporthe eres]|uniref:Uncharacterized protein n=1 Tax=Diaporthe eres TaxID=83184 RepID=A0ABR1NWS4_DIAER
MMRQLNSVASGDTVEDEGKPDVEGDRKPKQVGRRKGTPTPSLHRAVAQPNDPTTAQRITRLPQRPKLQQPTAAQRPRRVAPAVPKCPGKIHRTSNERSQPDRVTNRARGRSASSAEIHRGRSPAPAGNEKPRHESRGRSLRRTQSTGDRNRSRTRAQSVKRGLVKLFSGENKRDESVSRVIKRGASILLWEDEGRSASVQLRLDSIRAGSYDREKIIYLRVSVDVTRGNIEDVKNLFIDLQMRNLLGHDVPVDCKDTRADEYGAEAGGNGGGGELKLSRKRTKGTERQYSHRDRYELEVTQADNVLRSQLRRDGDTVVTSPPSHFKLQIIAAPPCDSGEMQITADLMLNKSKADGSWRPVPLEELKDPYNFDKWRGEDWERNGGCDSFETK